MNNAFIMDHFKCKTNLDKEFPDSNLAKIHQVTSWCKIYLSRMHLSKLRLAPAWIVNVETVLWFLVILKACCNTYSFEVLLQISFVAVLHDEIQFISSRTCNERINIFNDVFMIDLHHCMFFLQCFVHRGFIVKRNFFHHVNIVVNYLEIISGRVYTYLVTWLGRLYRNLLVQACWELYTVL